MNSITVGVTTQVNPNRKIGQILGDVKRVYPAASSQTTYIDSNGVRQTTNTQSLYYYGVDVKINGVSNNEILVDVPLRDFSSMRWHARKDETVIVEKVASGRWEVTGIINTVVANGTIKVYRKGSYISSGNLGFTSVPANWDAQGGANQFQYGSDVWGAHYIYDKFGNRVYI